MGGTEVVQGYPVPADADRSMFPYDSAATVVYWGDKAGNSLVRTLVDQVKDWLGHPSVVLSIAGQWGTDAKAAMEMSGDGINTCVLDVKAYWQGAACEAFVGYATQVQDVIKANVQVMDDMGKLVEDLHRVITETYQEGIRFIGDCARAIADAAATIAGQWIKLWGAVAEGILRALADFIDNVSRLSQKALGLMDQYVKGAHNIATKAVDLRIPDTMPTSAGEPGTWKVRPVS
jgi:hypothetical protein